MWTAWGREEDWDEMKLIITKEGEVHWSTRCTEQTLTDVSKAIQPIDLPIQFTQAEKKQSAPILLIFQYLLHLVGLIKKTISGTTLQELELYLVQRIVDCSLINCHLWRRLWVFVTCCVYWCSLTHLERACTDFWIVSCGLRLPSRWEYWNRQE